MAIVEPFSWAHACRVMGVTDRGLLAWKLRPVSHRQRRDMVLLTQIRDPLAGRVCLHARETPPIEPGQLCVEPEANACIRRKRPPKDD